MVKAYRLPKDTRPERYEIHLDARIGKPTFTGRLNIALHLARPTSTIELHAREITISLAQLRTPTGIQPARVAPDADAEMVALRFESAIPAGEASLEIEYEGVVSHSMEGLYLSQDGAEVALATQCEETDARAIFPCFDEPAFKASFHVAVTTDAEAIVLANAPLVDSDVLADGKTWRFAPTKPMSSYLFALAIGKFAGTPETTVRGTPIRVYAVQGKERLGAYAHELTAKLLPWFEDYFGARYHFDKYDQIAVPSFSAGAMENSGLVIFRQSLLLRDPATTSWQQEKLIARVIAHEFAHQWFGNLVTMAWWDDIWLNESFAEWMAHKSADVVAPEYGLWDDFYNNKREALVTDGLGTTHAIYTPVETPEQATELFDAVTYSKGSVLMRMIERFLGEEAFRAGLRTYMKEFSEKNAKGDDLWRHLERAASMPVQRLAQSWILQPGFPIVSASLHGATLTLHQRRYFGDPDAKPSDQVWAIPLVVRHADDAGVHETRHLFDAREGQLSLPAKGPIRWVNLNADAVGFYRQELSSDLRERLVAHAGELSAPEQRDLLDDAWGLVRTGKQSIGAFLDLLAGLVPKAKDHHVLAEAIGALDEIEELLTEEPAALAKFRAWTGTLLAPGARGLGYAPREGESRDDSERRALLLRAMARIARDRDAQSAAVALADREAQDPTSVDPTIAGAAVNVAARGGDAARHEKHVALYDARRTAGGSPQLAQRYLYSLVLFEDPKLLDRTLKLMAEGRFPLEALGPMLRMLLDERHGRDAGWEYLKTHWKDVRERLGDMWTGFLVEHSGNLPGRMRHDVVRFFDANLGTVAQQSYARALEAMDVRTAFEKRVTPDLVAQFA